MSPQQHRFCFPGYTSALFVFQDECRAARRAPPSLLPPIRRQSFFIVSTETESGTAWMRLAAEEETHLPSCADNKETEEPKDDSDCQ